MKTSPGLATLLILLVLTAAPAAAQTGSTAVTGTVVDSEGATLPGVTVILRGGQGCSCDSCDNPETCRCCPNERVAVTDSQGEFGFRHLDPGSYGVTAELDGFGSASVAAEVSYGQSVDLEIVLSKASDEEVIVVEYS